MRRLSVFACVGLLYLLACGEVLRAQDQNEKQEPLVTKIYRVVDLVVPAPSYPYQGTYLPAVGSITAPRSFGGMGGGMGGGGMGGGMGMFQVPDNPQQPPAGGGGSIVVGGRAGSTPAASSHPTGQRPQPSNRISMDTLIETIVTTIDPSSWDEVGGPGSVSPIGGALAVSQSDAIHGRLKEFLDTLRRENGTQQVVTTEAVWLSLTQEQLLTLQGKREEGTLAGKPIDPAALAALPAETRRYRGQITSFNGQTVHLVSGQIKSTVLGAIPVVGGNDVGYQPIVAEPHLGVLLEITPTALSVDEGVLIDLHSTITTWQKAGDARKIATGNVQKVIEIDQINVAAQQFATSLRLPRGKPVLVGGINIPTTDESGREETSDVGLYLVITVHAGS